MGCIDHNAPRPSLMSGLSCGRPGQSATCYHPRMATATLPSVEEYLHKSFLDGDQEYIEGELLERNLGEVDHSHTQSSVVFYLRVHFPNFWSGVAVRVQVKARRIRVPDVCLIRGGKPTRRIITTPPFLVVEVLSPEDRMSEMQERINDYLEFGVPFVWVVDPMKHRAFV